jgi:hypothetical protein
MIVMFPIALPTLYRHDQMIVRLDALYKSHIKNHDISQWLQMENTGDYSSWASLSLITGRSSGSFGWRINMCRIDMVTGVMLGLTISGTTGTNA